jgi:DNA-binding LacI/PurR family transcriptional regulator
MRLLVDHLRANGHQRIGFFGFEPSFSWARTRLGTFLGTIMSSGLPHDSADIIAASKEAAHSYSPADLRDHLPKIRARIKAGVKGWVCSSYVLAQALCGLLRGAGYRVPGDISVTGIHGGERIQQPGIPHPTTVEADDQALGAAAVHLLNFRKLRSVPAPSVLLLPVRLIQGDSTEP